VSWNSFMDKSIPDPPTAVLLHGILGSRKNWGEGVPVDTPWILIVIEVYWLVHPEFRSITWRTDRYATVFLDHSLQVSSKQNVIDALIQEGFSTDIARQFLNSDLHIGRETVENVPRGVHVNFLKAERSLHRWALEDLRRIRAAEELAADEGAGVQLHVLEDAGHWVCSYVVVHADNPDGLFRILSSSFLGLRTR
ncbi:hypothetical protein B296_00030266, partial [Ensete ventricosum]